MASSSPPDDFGQLLTQELQALRSRLLREHQHFISSALAEARQKGLAGARCEQDGKRPAAIVPAPTPTGWCDGPTMTLPTGWMTDKDASKGSARSSPRSSPPRDWSSALFVNGSHNVQELSKEEDSSQGSPSASKESTDMGNGVCMIGSLLSDVNSDDDDDEGPDRPVSLPCMRPPPVDAPSSLPEQLVVSSDLAPDMPASDPRLSYGDVMHPVCSEPGPMQAKARDSLQSRSSLHSGGSWFSDDTDELHGPVANRDSMGRDLQEDVKESLMEKIRQMKEKEATKARPSASGAKLLQPKKSLLSVSASGLGSKRNTMLGAQRVSKVNFSTVETVHMDHKEDGEVEEIGECVISKIASLKKNSDGHGHRPSPPSGVLSPPLRNSIDEETDSESTPRSDVDDKDDARSDDDMSQNSVDYHNNSLHHDHVCLDVWTGTKKHKRSRRTLQSARQSRMAQVIMQDSELGEDHSVGSCVFHPSCRFTIMWNFGALLLILYDCCIVPLEAFDLPEGGFLGFMDWLLRIYWTVNVIISFHTGYFLSTGSAEMRRAKIAKTYILSWFGIDLFVVSIDWFEAFSALGLFADTKIDEAGQMLRGVRTIRLLRGVRIIRVTKANRLITQTILDNMQSETSQHIAGILKMVSFVLMLMHLMACAWYGLGSYYRPDEGESTWVADAGVGDKSLFKRYFTAFHWSLEAFNGTTLYKPTNGVELLFCVVVLFFTFMVAASFISSITTSMTRLHIISGKQSSEIAKLKKYLAEHDISRTLALRVTRNAQHAMLMHERNMSEAGVELLKFISEPLRVELHFEVHSVTLMIHPFFVCYSEVNPMGVRKVCHNAVAPVSLSSGDVLFSDHEPSRPFMFFIINGTCMYEQAVHDEFNGDASTNVEAVRSNRWMCEAPLWTTWWHCGTLKAFSETQMLSLDAQKFQQICGSFPSEHAATYCRSYVDWLNNTPADRLTDIGSFTPEFEMVVDLAFPDHAMNDELDIGHTQSRMGSMRSSISMAVTGGRIASFKKKIKKLLHHQEKGEMDRSYSQNRHKKDWRSVVQTSSRQSQEISDKAAAAAKHSKPAPSADSMENLEKLELENMEHERASILSAGLQRLSLMFAGGARRMSRVHSGVGRQSSQRRSAESVYDGQPGGNRCSVGSEHTAPPLIYHQEKKDSERKPQGCLQRWFAKRDRMTEDDEHF
eukprot:TRINITY_DN121576_c0_g1_i1.p1 TRINITY_DN121576_c0_g1~~TRINITY_DN121576_c0_g1_i1.p1  ORF type:complete len:1184 (-),score=252.01 TRINITY_DN121576_c0_g1_i1:60-3611(-)